MKKKNYSKQVSLKRINENWIKEKSWIIRDTPLFRGMFTTNQELPENVQFFNCTFLGEKKRQRWEMCIQTSRSQVSHEKEEEIAEKAATLIEDEFWIDYMRYPKRYLKNPEMKFPVLQNKTLSEWKKEQYSLAIEGKHISQESCRVSPFIDHRMGDFLYITVNAPSITVDVICQTIQEFLDSDRQDWQRECTVIIDDAKKLWDDCCIGLKARECRKKDISYGREIPLY